MDLNKRLSNWDALHTCFCGYWSWLAAKRVYEHTDGARRRTTSAEVAACAECGYDLTREPLANLRALTAKDWTGTVRGSCFYVEGAGFAIPEGADCVFVDCNLDNVRLPGKGVVVTGGSHRLLIEQTDRTKWACDWTTETPLEPLDLKLRELSGISADPADLPARPLTDAEIAAAEKQAAQQIELAEAQATVVRLSTELVKEVNDIGLRG